MDLGAIPPTVEEQRAVLARTPVHAPVRYRIIHVGTYWQGETDIVRRMVEALRGLGHEVAAVDARTWPGLEASRRADGLHAVELDTRLFDPLVDRFQPDAVVFNAGGFHPTAEGAAALRARGVPMIHLVLSDPDVCDATLSYLGRVDAVATNAASCVERYERAGAPCVVHLPFGIDRSFILREVPPRPDRRADVICVGHGRPDRQATMRALADRFDVRVYGARWELPAEVVRGDDVIAALDQGTFHVNFPRTYAGFTNVKVGVFESVARGGVLCTERTEEMAALFAFDEEIVGYADADDLVEQIDGLLRDPARVDRMRRRALARVIGEHLLEHRWTALFERLRSAGVLGAVGAARRPRLVVLDPFGVADLPAISEAEPGAVVTAVCVDPVRALELGFEAVSIEAVAESAVMLREADAVLREDGSRIDAGDVHRTFAATITSLVATAARAAQARVAEVEGELHAERRRHAALRSHPVVRAALGLRRVLRGGTRGRPSR